MFSVKVQLVLVLVLGQVGKLSENRFIVYGDVTSNRYQGKSSWSVCVCVSTSEQCVVGVTTVLGFLYRFSWRLLTRMREL